jgi:hypothetical protein
VSPTASDGSKLGSKKDVEMQEGGRDGNRLSFVWLTCGQVRYPRLISDTARASGKPVAATVPPRRRPTYRPTLVCHPLHQQESTSGRETRILVHVHPGDLPLSTDSLATNSLIRVPRMNNLHGNHT